MSQVTSASTSPGSALAGIQIHYPDELPVSQRRDDIAAAIRDHQVVVVAGETGSGKTTQLPKICLELGRGGRKRIGHTQPRRIAARSVAERLAEELGTEVGGPDGVVGYQVRFTDRSGARTRVKLMTDGILLAELQRDRTLSSYDTLIIDEAHERSLNIDFILGYLKQLLPRRPDLKVIITSATIDPERFAAHFADRDGNPAPIVEVSGRTYPVEVRYRPLVDETYADPHDTEGELLVRDQTEAIVDAVRELAAEGDGDILVFLPGEREIRDTADVLAGSGLDKLDHRGLEVVPLYARLSSAEQHKVFAPHAGRRVVLATNVAETSLTVPGIRYVVDTGYARISRYSYRTKVQRLPIEPISQASANQRKGRCGRVAAGVCIRLYSEEDFEARPEFTDPEILRTNLASVILQMTALGLGDVSRFPFVDPPDQRHVKAGVQLLEELGGLSTASSSGRRQRGRGGRRLTRIGRQLVALPVDPRIARMVVEADRRGCLREVLVIAAALSIQDPRERPADARTQADQKHARFRDETSDFLTVLNLWCYVRRQQRELSSSAFRRMCRAEYLNYLRIREWQDLESQLRQVVKQLKLKPGQPADEPDADGVHQSLLAGLLSHVGLRDPERRDYLGARNTRFSIFPGSGLFKKQPQLVMSAELVETSKLYARVNAAVRPEWAEELGSHLVKRTYSEPHWSKKRAAVMAYERVTLYGVPLVADRLVSYGKVDPALARELFIRHALVYGEWHTRHKFFAKNRALLEEAEELEHRARRRDIVVDEHTLFDFYDARVGAEVVSGAHFDSWWKAERRRRPELLTFDPTMLVNESASEVTAEAYPDRWREADLTLSLHYQFEPGADADGVTVDLPVTTLNQVQPQTFSWQVPGLRHELVVALIRSLPKALRVNFVPAPNVAREFLDNVTPGEESLVDALSRFLRGRTGVHVPPEAWDWSKVPDHLRPTFRVVNEEGGVVAEGKDLDQLKEPLRPRFDRAMSEAAADVTVSGQVTWTFGTLERSFTRTRAGHEVRGFPALVDEGKSVGVEVFGSEAEQLAAHRLGLRRLLMLNVTSPAKGIADSLSNADKLGLAGSPYPTVADLLEDCVAAAVDELVERHGGPVWEEASYDALVRDVGAGVEEATRVVLYGAIRVLAEWRETDRALTGSVEMPMLPALADMKAQVGRLVQRGFVAEAGATQLRQVPRYLAAVRLRRTAVRRWAVRGPRSPADGPRAAAARGLPAPCRGVARGSPAERRTDPGAMDARGVPGQPLGAASRHRLPGLRHPGPQGPRPSLTRMSAASAIRPRRSGRADTVLSRVDSRLRRRPGVVPRPGRGWTRECRAARAAGRPLRHLAHDAGR
jgi:ATP-dependent helicase HrpA